MKRPVVATMDLSMFVESLPKSALSARHVLTLENCEQKDFVVSLIDDAVYCDSWEAYFSFAERNNIAITEDVALAAIQAVGLDPLSGPLWVKAAACCNSPESRMRLYEFGLSVPLHSWRPLYEEYRKFTESADVEPALTEEDCKRVAEVLNTEQWPDRYATFETDAESGEIRCAWLDLVSLMMLALDNCTVEKDLQLRRIDLAMRQMCAQLPGDDSCFYQYALFQWRFLDDCEGARKTVSSGLAICGNSFALENIAAALGTSASTINNPESTVLVTPTEVLLQQRGAAENLTSLGIAKERVRALRWGGKTAAQQGLGDWKIFSQWRLAEDMAARDPKMAAKVLENGMICCSHSSNDALLLGSEAAQYHLFQRHERETLGYAEQLIELQTGLKHRGKTLASWNSLVRIENLLGLSFSKAAKRRTELFPQNHIATFMEHCRVGSYSPCSGSTFEWLQFMDDYSVDKSSVEETPFSGIVPPRNKSIAVKWREPAECEVPDDSLWESYVAPQDSLPPQDEENPDDVTGARELRGKLVYRVKVDPRTAARCHREEKTRQQSSAGEEVAERGGALGALMKRTRSIILTGGQAKRLRSVSADWLVDLLTGAELDLERVLKDRSGRRAAPEAR